MNKIIEVCIIINHHEYKLDYYGKEYMIIEEKQNYKTKLSKLCVI